MTVLRSLLFNLLFYAATLVIGVIALPLLLAPPAALRWLGKRWSGLSIGLLRAVAGTGYQVRGIERIPKGPVIFAAKHQSAWDTLFFPAYLGDPAMVAKAELRFIPFYGWYAWRAGTVWIDRSRGPSALRRMLAGAQAALDEGRAIVVFPQGTRTAPGATADYQPGVAALYAGTDARVVPVALNSGLFWPRRGFAKRPGTITVEFLDPLPAGLDRRAFLSLLGERIDAATIGLEAEARDQ
jgi:1-acyl-sn-glycerol-3-phosphate acyltransferase